jgi:ribosomal-protein-alanine N-acetyltransferase
LKNPYLVGKRIYLRPLEPSDAAIMQPWANDSSVTRNITLFRPASIKTELDFIERAATSTTDIALGIVLPEGDRLIGSAGLMQIDWKNRSTLFGISIGEPAQWGKGYGTEATQLLVALAFERLNLHRVSLLVYEYNDRGIRCYERVGFKREGVHRDHVWMDGRYWNAHTMAILREEWKPQ